MSLKNKEKLDQANSLKEITAPPSSPSPAGISKEGKSGTAVGTREVVAELSRVNRLYYDAFQSLDMKQMKDMWWHNSRVSCIHPGWDIRYGWAEVKESYEMIFEGTTSIRVALGNVKVQVFGSLAFVTCVENLLSEEEQGSGEFLGAVLASNIFEQRGGRWKLLHRHTSLFSPDDVDLPEGPLH